jgi:transcriptional regulator with XRE-family HTH domain
MEPDIEKRARIDLGRRIVELRERTGMLQLELARRVGIERSRLSKWERGLHHPLVHHLVSIADALEVPLDLLFRGEIPPAPPQGAPPLETNVRATLARVVSSLNRLLHPESSRRQRLTPPKDRGPQCRP